MAHAREDRNCGRLNPDKNVVGIIVLVFGVILSSGCTHKDPQAAYDHARETYHQGAVVAAAEEAKRGYKQFHGTSAEWAWKFRMLESDVLLWQGRGAEVLTLLASESAPLPSGDLTVRRLKIEGAAYNSLGKSDEAASRLSSAEKLCAVSDYPTCGEVFNVLGSAEMDRAHYGPAHVLFEHALTLARTSRNQFLEANSLLNLSWSAEEQAHFDEALYWVDAARQISIAHGYADVSQTALGNMGWAYYKLGDPEKAEGLLIDAKKRAKNLDDVDDQLTWLTNLGYIYMDGRDFKVAKQCFLQSLALSKSREVTMNSLIALAFVSEQTENLDDAKRYADDGFAKALENKNGRDQVYLLLVQGRVAARLHDAVTAENAFRKVAGSPDTPVFLKWEAERSLARLYEEESKFDAANREYRTALSTFEIARSGLQHEDSRLPFLTNASRIYDDYIHFLIARGRTAEALQVAEFSRARTLLEGLGWLPKGTPFVPSSLDAQQIARGAGGTVLFYWLGEEQSYLWAITPQKVALFQLPRSEEIKIRVERYRKAIIDQRESLPTAIADGIELYRVLVGPAKDILPKQGKVFVIPDGSLNSLNFETLLAPGQQPHYWVEDVTLSSASSLRMLQAFHVSHSKGAGNLLLFGDAIAPNEDFPQLPKAATEMESIEKHFPPGQQQVFSRDQANPTAYLASTPERFSYIHFVAHGTASRLSPLDSAIVLSKASAEDNSFKLYARDIIQHPLRAELVTVSTCRSAGTRAYSGEGLVGLSWAFVRAGAHNVIGALWDVSDGSTPQLMDELYGDLKKGETPDAALRNAKLTLLHSSGSFKKPFYWAPFQLYTGS